ncbi:hypothetical protein [Actinoallomurus sp. CA-142502]|uniref:hypothetical protein n=1 Tax=Actinoallomurus sp. CA-142502 TaxID=3239885 RepID=UPI003D8A52BD
MSFTFSLELVQLQVDWFVADQARTAAAKSGDDAAFKAAGQRLQDLTHKLVKETRKHETPYQARMALREAARKAMAGAQALEADSSGG